MRRLGFLLLGLCAMTFSQNAHGDIWVSGHGDIAAHYEDGQLHLGFHFEDPDNPPQGPGGVNLNPPYEPNELIIGVPGPSITRPAGIEWDFLGAPTDQIWFLPETSDSNKPFLGFGLEELVKEEWDDTFTWSLLRVIPPPSGGNFALWKGLNTPTPFMSTVDGVNPSSDFFEQPLSSGHDHFTLGFTGKGIYAIELQLTGTHLTDGVKSGTAIFTFDVGLSSVPEPSSVALLSCAGIGMAAGWVRRIRKAKSPS
jgi:hypothetical protein